MYLQYYYISVICLHVVTHLAGCESLVRIPKRVKIFFFHFKNYKELVENSLQGGWREEMGCASIL